MVLGAEFWEKQKNNFWAEIDEVALLAILAGGSAGVRLLPKAIQPFVNVETFHQFAMDYLRRYQLTNVRQITETTRRKLVPLLNDWLRSGDHLSVLENALAGVLNDPRAKQIAVTEVTRLFADGNLLAWRSSGVVTSKVWRTARDELVCPLCGPLEGVTVEINTRFTQDAETIGGSKQMRALLGGRYTPELGAHRAGQMLRWQSPSVQAPPRHVNCRCSLHPVVSVQAYENAPIPGTPDPIIIDTGTGYGEVIRP